MNKDDIKKALKCCQDYDYESCVDCPYRTHGENCTNDILQDALELIGEQEKENERVNKELSEKEENRRIIHALCDSYRNDYWETFQRLEVQQQEVERLKAENEQLEEDIDMMIKEQKYEHQFDIAQAQIDILNKAKKKLDSAPNGWAYTGYIDEMIEELQK